MSEEKPVVFVIDDDQLVRESLQRLFRSVDLGVRAFPSPQEFLASKQPNSPGCMVLDVRLPGISGLDFQCELIKANIQYPIIFISGHGDIPMTVRALKAGAIEFLTKPFRDQDLLEAVQRGIDRDCARRRDALALTELQDSYAALTPREREILTFLMSGCLNKQIAADLNLSEATVKVHRGNIMRKMEANSIVELVRMADRLELAVPKS